jgi:hypothetical protein
VFRGRWLVNSRYIKKIYSKESGIGAVMQFAEHEDASNRSPSRRCIRGCKDFDIFIGIGELLRGLPPSLNLPSACRRTQNSHCICV